MLFSAATHLILHVPPAAKPELDFRHLLKSPQQFGNAQFAVQGAGIEYRVFRLPFFLRQFFLQNQTLNDRERLFTYRQHLTHGLSQQNESIKHAA